jgi:N-acetylmuramoyl-L-alanine amidase
MDTNQAGQAPAIQPGETCAVARDIVIEGVIAYATGERVVVEAIVPDALRPQYKYVIFSRAPVKRFALSDADVVSLEAAQAVPARAPTQAAAPLTQNWRAWTLAAGLAALAVIAIVSGIVMFQGGGGTATGAVVCLDPGHGGNDTGALENEVAEKDVNLDIALRTRDLLEAAGYRVVMTRDSDRAVSLAQRCTIANGSHAAALVSIHNNARPPDVQGTTTYYYRGSDEGAELAEDVQRGVVAKISRPDRGTRESRLYMVRNAAMPAALLEGVFLTSKEEAWLITDTSFRRKIAEGTAAGIEDYIRSAGVAAPQ